MDDSEWIYANRTCDLLLNKWKFLKKKNQILHKFNHWWHSYGLNCSKFLITSFSLIDILIGQKCSLIARTKNRVLVPELSLVECCTTMWIPWVVSVQVYRKVTAIVYLRTRFEVLANEVAALCLSAWTISHQQSGMSGAFFDRRCATNDVPLYSLQVPTVRGIFFDLLQKYLWKK